MFIIETFPNSCFKEQWAVLVADIWLQLFIILIIIIFLAKDWLSAKKRLVFSLVTSQYTLEQVEECCIPI